MNYMFVEYLNMKLNLGKQSQKEMLAYLFVLSLLALFLFILLIYINRKDKKNNKVMKHEEPTKIKEFKEIKKEVTLNEDENIKQKYTKEDEIAENFETFYDNEMRYSGANYVLNKDIKTMDENPMFLENKIKYEEAKILREIEMKNAISKLENVLNKKLKTNEDTDGE